MGFLDRIGKIATGIGGALQAPVGLVYDLARAPFVDEAELDGFVNVLYGRTTARGGQFFGNVLGPEEGLGAAVGGLPTAVRAPIRAVTDPALAGLEFAGREFIREPLTAAVTATSLMQAGQGLDFGRGYQIAQNRSLGQAISLAILTEDITDEAEVAEAQLTDWHQAISGTFDAASRLFLEPDALLSGGVTAARRAGTASRATQALAQVPGAAGLVEKGIFGRTIRSAKDVEAALVHPALGVINEQIGRIKTEAADIDVAAARIRDLAFPDHRDGAIVSRVLAEAEDLDLAWGALMGHKPSVEQMWGTKPDVMGRISRLQGDQARISQMERMVGTIGPDQLPLELPDEIAAVRRTQVDAELTTLYDTEARIAYHEQASAMVTEIPRISAASERRSAFTRSNFFRTSAAAAPLRQAINMRPRNLIDLNDAAGDVHVTRLLRKARLPLEEQDGLRGAYMAASDPVARQQVLAQVEGAAIRNLAVKHGIADPDVERLVDMASRGRAAAMKKLTGSRQIDEQGRAFISEIDPDTGVTHRVSLPPGEFNHFPLPDLDAVEKVFARHGDELALPGAALDKATELIEGFQRLWKPSVLIRVGWPIRVVGEEQMRIMSQIGALTTAGRTAMFGARYLKDLGVDVFNDAGQAIRRIPRSQRSFRGGLTREQSAQRRGLRLDTMNIRGAEVESSFGTADSFRAEYRTANSARGAMEAVTSTADDLRNRMRDELFEEGQSLTPTARNYGPSWERAVNEQIAGDAVWRRFVEGTPLDEVRDWLDNTVEGRAYKKRVGHWKGREDDWLEYMAQTVEDYLPTDELKTLALGGKARLRDLERAVPDVNGRPHIHGAGLDDVHNATRFAQVLGGIRDKAMTALGTIPTDVLSRNNYFDQVYTSEVTRLVNLAADQGTDLTPEVLRSFEAKARNHALGKSKALLYDMADESELSHMLRFISPFYSAWQEVTTRWTGIAIENPAFVARLHEAWRSPERMGIVTDEDGNRINADGTATNPLGEKVTPGKDRLVSMKLLASDNVVGKALFNDLTRALPGTKRVENARFNKDSANLILQGAPGVGPVVQMPLNEIAKGRPELEESLRWALPFGASQSTVQMLLPATARRAQTLAKGEEDRLYSNQLMRIYWDMQVDHNLGKRAEPPTYAEAKRKTNDFYKVRTLASFVSPVAPNFQSPYQMYIDFYRALQEADTDADRNAPGYRSPDEIFLETHGEEFFPLTQSLSKTMDGVPSTIEGAAARKKYQDLVERHPELGGLIVGSEGTGEFSNAVYQAQLQDSLRPGSGEKQRKALSPEEAMAKPNERLGWIEFSKAMDLIDAERMNRGLPNLQVKAAGDLRELKGRVINGLRTKYPEWAATFDVTDRGAWNRKLTGLREIAADDRLAGRQEIAGLREYLSAREQVLAALAARKAAGGPATLTSAGNRDLAGLWANVTAQLTDGNPLFSQLYYRYLERDPMEVEA